ncbi:MAG: septum formation protein Maf [Acidobacteriota bacterium]|nr:MAG: septum formation protein Maf [Acidobacteriota bacterium]
MITLPKIVLASGSPRRSEIMAAVGWEFEKRVADVDESPVIGESPEDYVVRLAIEKAAAVASEMPGRIVLGADTTVVIDGEIIGKPTDLDDARRMLKLLSGRRHEVLTGVALVSGESVASGIERTGVIFSSLNDAEIDFLAEKGEPLDKAGAYAVQAQAALFITGIEGDYWNVVGLPIGLVYRLFWQLQEVQQTSAV